MTDVPEPARTSRRRVLSRLGTAGTTVACLGGAGSGTVAARTDSVAAADGRIATSQAAKLVPEDGDRNDFFGLAVALADDGSTAIVTAPSDEDPNGEDAGSAYVFGRGSGDWTEQTKLVPGDGDGEDRFGESVALSADGTTALVAAYVDEDPVEFDAGSVYVFERRDGTWRQSAKYAAADGDSGDSFGRAVALSSDGTNAVVGAYQDEDPNGEEAGAAYVFGRSGTDWRQRAKLLPGDGDGGDHFGGAVSLSADGTTAVVGAEDDEDPNGATGPDFGGSGSAYVFESTAGEWRQRAKLVARDGGPEDGFGTSLAVSGDGSTVLVAAPGHADVSGAGSGAAYAFESTTGGWTQRAKLHPEDVGRYEAFGDAVALSGDGTVGLVGAADDSDQGIGAGAAYLFDRGADGWRRRAKLTANDGTRDDLFGTDVALAADAETALAGAMRDDDPAGQESGSAYVFEQPSGSVLGLGLPGFGVGAALGALGAGALWRRVRTGRDGG